MPFKIKRFKQVQRLQQHRSLGPGGELVDVNPLVVGGDRFFDMNLPPVQVFQRDQSAVLGRAADDFRGDITPVEALVGSKNGLMPRFSGSQCRRLGIDQFLQRSQQVRLAENLACIGRRPLFAVVFIQVRQEDVL